MAGFERKTDGKQAFRKAELTERRILVRSFEERSWKIGRKAARNSPQRCETMFPIHEDCIVDGQGRQKAFVVPIEEWRKILEALEDLDDVRAYEEAKSYPTDSIPFEEAVREIREGGPC